MNNYHDQSENEPVECNICHSSMTESDDGKKLTCDKLFCVNEIELKGESNE